MSHPGAVTYLKLHKNKATVVLQPDSILLWSDGFWFKERVVSDQKCHDGT